MGKKLKFKCVEKKSVLMDVDVVGNARRTASSAKALAIVERALHSPTSFDAVVI